MRPDTVARLDQFSDLFDKVAKETGVKASILKGIAAAESDGNPRAGEKTSGYKGLMQAERDDKQLDPETSIRAGAKKFSDFTNSLTRLLRPLGLNFASFDEQTRLRWVMCAYNAGPGTVQKACAYAQQAGDVLRWQDAEHYQRALIYYGAYSTRAYAPKGTTQAQIDDAEQWRHRLTHQDLTIDQVRERAPALVVRSIVKKWENTPGYVEKVVQYASFYDHRGATTP